MTISKELINDKASFEEWLSFKQDDYFCIEEYTEMPENYPCIVIYATDIDDDARRDNLVYHFVYLSDFSDR